MPKENSLARIEKPALVDLAPGAGRATMALRVFRLLREAIITLQLRPGDMLSEADVSRQMGVSRQPVREAFIKLSEIGLVEIVPQRGTFVVKISKDDVSNAQFVREAIEVAIVRRACEVATEADLAEIRRVIEEQKDALKRDDRADFLALDEAFHGAVAEAARCAAARRSIEAVDAQLDRVRFLSLPLFAHMPTIIASHEKILAALEARDADTAERAMREHLSALLRIYLPEVASKYAEHFTDDNETRPPATLQPVREA
jgi:DNA-binding GntR family transcriptional regulator